MEEFVNFRVFTHFSNFESIIKIEPLVKFCKDNNFLACVICDRMNLFGAADFSNYCFKYKIKPIIGCLLKVTNIGYIPVYIYNEIGYKNLSFLLSQVYMNNNTSIDILELFAYKEGLIAFSGDECLLNIDSEEYINFILSMKNEFKDNFFIEINISTMINIDHMINISETYNIPIVTTTTTRFLQSKDAVALQIFKLIESGDFYDSSIDFEWKEMYYKKYGDIDSKLKIGIENGINIAKKCCFGIVNKIPIIPLYDLSNNTDVEKELYKQTIEGLIKKKGVITAEYQARIDTEMNVLISKNFCNYFLVTADFIKYAKDNNISVGPGRGSGVGCLVAYSLDITSMDPIEHGLLFERFLNPERASLPDFDIDFEPDRRHEVIEYITKKYGKYGVVQIITYIILQARAVTRDVGRICRISFKELNHITSLIPQDQINPVKLGEALVIIPELVELYNKDTRYKFIFDIALKLEGLVRNFSKHAAGVIISHIPIYERCPLYRDAKGDIVTQFDLKYLENIGLIKFDFLGLKTLTHLNDGVKLIKERYNKNFNLNNISLDDKKVFNMLNSNNKLPLEGIFQFEGNALNDEMIKLKATNFNDLVALNALYRPGPIDNIPHYINRKHGKEEIIYLHKDLSNDIKLKLDKVLKSTYGILVYQEQIMQSVCILANFTLADADLLRRAMGKKKQDEMAATKEKFCKGCEQNNISRSISEEIFSVIEKFAGYAFNKSHAVAYSFIAYQCLYLKCHYLNEFTESYLKSESGDIFKITKYFYEMRTKGFIITKPNIQISKEYCSINNNNLYLGLKEIANINITLATNIVKHAPYKNIYEFVDKNKSLINKKNWNGLVYSGALDFIDIHNNIKFKYNNIYYKRSLLFKNMELILSKQMPNEDIDEIILENELELNEDAFTITPEFNSLIFKNILSKLNITTIDKCIEVGEYKVCAAIISIKRKRKGDRLYAFIEIGDHTSICDFALFNEELVFYSNKYTKTLTEGRQFIFHIKVNKTKIALKKMYTINEYFSMFNNIDISINNIEELHNKCDKLIKLNGNTRVNLLYNNNKFETNFYINPTLNNLYNLIY